MQQYQKLTGKRLMLAGTGSGCGKTTAACGILYGLKKRGLSVQAWKSGPDYIDPMFHKRVLQTGCGNLDLFFSGADTVCMLLAQQAKKADISVIEGAMGYYDGIGMSEQASCYELAAVTGTPVVLVVDPSGMGNSVAALLEGFIRHRSPSLIQGVLFNRVSKKRYEALKPLAAELGLVPLGYLPVQNEFVLKSRHLGLVTAGEIDLFHEKLEKFYQLIQYTVDWEALLRLSDIQSAVTYQEPAQLTGAEPLLTENTKADDKPLTIGIAQDEAFCFLYEDNLRYLQRHNCKLVYFSPLHDKELPEGLDAMILCGGYPELYARELSENQSMRISVKNAILKKIPCIAECGGFLYLQSALTDMEGKQYPMAGVLSGTGFRGKGLERFGYVHAGLQTGRLFGRESMQLRAHEFHYFDCEPCGEAFLIQKASGEKSWLTGVAEDQLYAGFPHIYFYGNEEFASAFISCARAYRTKRSCAEHMT